MESTNQTAIEEAANCGYSPHNQASLEGRFWLVVVFGTFISVASALQNLFIFIVLCQKKHNRHSVVLYILLLALLDFLIATFYILLMSVSVLADYLLDPKILNAWFWYMPPSITISHISMSASGFLIASFERFCITCWQSKFNFVNAYRQWIAGFAILLGIISKFTMYLELVVTHQEGCKGTMVEYNVGAAPIVYDYYYNLLWRIFFRNLITIWLPFILLLIMNMKIIHALRHADVEPLVKQKLSEVQRKNRVRTATRTLILIVFTYLMANVLNVIVTLWEYFDIESLHTDSLIIFYTYSVDIVSILTVFSGAFRPLIYMACMPQVRKDVLQQLNRCAGRDSPVQSKNGGMTGINLVLVRISELLLKYPNFTARTSVDSNFTDETEKASGEVFL